MIKKFNYRRFVKFSIVGVTSSSTDFAVLNALSLLTGINKGLFAAFFSTISFLIANVGSFYLNKKWTFKKNNENSRYRVFLKVSAIGAAINIFIIYFLTTFLAQNYFSGLVWLNISKIIATIVVAFFNYSGYKKYVFNGEDRK